MISNKHAANPAKNICKKCGQIFIQRYLHTDGKTYSLQRRKFCVQCSPFKSHNTRDLTKPPSIKKKRNYDGYDPLAKLPEKHLTINWPEIQSFYDSGKTWREIRDIHKIPFHVLAFASKTGLFKSRTVSETARMLGPTRPKRRMSEETKQKLRTFRLNYLAENPDKCSWKTHDKFKSIPCEAVKKELRELDLLFIEEFQPLLHKKRFYSVDIAFIDKKIIFEINGGQHYDTNTQLKPYYQTRHDLIEAEGWKVYEIPYHVAMRKGFVIDFIVPVLNGKKPVYDVSLYQKGSKIGTSVG